MKSAHGHHIPEMDGIGVDRLLKEDLRLRDIPVISNYVGISNDAFFQPGLCSGRGAVPDPATFRADSGSRSLSDFERGIPRSRPLC